MDSTPIRPSHPLKSPDFRRFQLARIFSVTGGQMQSAAIGYQIYEWTNQPIYLGYVGLVLFLPAVLFLLFTGHVADLVDRRKVMLTALCVSAACSGALAYYSSGSSRSVGVLFLLLFISASASAFYAPASQALMPNLVPRESFPQAVKWNSLVWQGGAIAGPALGGLVYSRVGGGWGVYLITLSSLLIGAGMVSRISYYPIRSDNDPVRDTSWRTMFAGMQYVWSSKIILGALSLDLFAVLLGGTTALLPVYARDILHVDESGFGMLRAAVAVGAALMAVALGFMAPFKRSGWAMLNSVAIFGIATIIFAVSKNFWLSMFCLAVMGASDMVSVVIRLTLVQMMTPPAMRGRVSAVNIVFIGASNELGDFESGLFAQWLGAVRAVIVGGVGTLMVTGLWAIMFPALREFKALESAEPEKDSEKEAKTI